MLPDAPQNDISQLVTDILKRLKEQAPKGGTACFDFTGSSSMVVSLVQRMLLERGFTALVSTTMGPPRTERMYVNVVRRTREPKPEKPEA